MTTKNLLSAALVVLATATFTTGLAATAPLTMQSQDEHPKFPAGEGRDLTIKVCSSCHEAEVLAEQSLDEEGWKNMVGQMASMGASATEEQLDQIVKYLAKAFPAK